MHELEKMKKAQEQQVDEMSIQKLRERITRLALPVDMQRHQESLWRENLQSGGKPAQDNSHKL